MKKGAILGMNIAKAKFHEIIHDALFSAMFERNALRPLPKIDIHDTCPLLLVFVQSLPRAHDDTTHKVPEVKGGSVQACVVDASIVPK